MREHTTRRIPADCPLLELDELDPNGKGKVTTFRVSQLERALAELRDRLDDHRVVLSVVQEKQQELKETLEGLVKFVETIRAYGRVGRRLCLWTVGTISAVGGVVGLYVKLHEVGIVP